MKFYLDGDHFTDKDTAYQYMIRQLNLPDYTGHNLDALWDVLGDQEAMEIEIYQARLFLDYLGDYGRSLLDLFGDLKAEKIHQVTLYW